MRALHVNVNHTWHGILPKCYPPHTTNLLRASSGSFVEFPKPAGDRRDLGQHTRHKQIHMRMRLPSPCDWTLVHVVLFLGWFFKYSTCYIFALPCLSQRKSNSIQYY
ncbi:hypothetical protein M434DRAFT_396535 [Hypoxylon sp. CO27-5]|nr:hypothetical protein M434DRAFT_396535 [Hypoxylon sp. CO27-5]